MKNLDEIAQAVIALFPVQRLKNGAYEATTHRVETSPVKDDANKLDVVIVQLFPTPAKRFELTIERLPEPAWLVHPKRAPDYPMAQAVAMRLQSKALGESGPAITSFRHPETGLFATRFVTDVVPPAAAAAAAPAGPTSQAVASEPAAGETPAPEVPPPPSPTKRRPSAEVAA